jgi:hypothetical protein
MQHDLVAAGDVNILEFQERCWRRHSASRDCFSTQSNGCVAW